MERLRNLDRYQKGVLLVMAIMVLVFTAIYCRTISRVGFEYQNAILVPSQENGNTVYSGKLQGKQARFTVSADKTVVFQHGSKTYGPYTAKADPAAIPADAEMAQRMTGVELRQGDTILFRGGVLDAGDLYWLYGEDGTSEGIGIFYTEGGTTRDENGNIVDPIAPSASVILKLMNGPELTHKGVWVAWFGAVLICVLTVLSILFADELFLLGLSFWVRNADRAEPSDWELARRYIGWTLAPIAAFAVFLIGLQ